MNLKETMKKEKSRIDDVRKRLDLDSFGEIMDEFIRKSRMALLVTKEENEEEWHVQGVGCGAVMDFYVLTNALQPLYLQMLEEMNHEMDPEKLATSLCEVLRDSLIEAAKEADGNV